LTEGVTLPIDEDYPNDRRYTAQHQWVMPDGDDGSHLVGITRFCYQRLDAILSLELPEPGEFLQAGELYGHIQSLVGPLQELYAPVSGTVVAVNEELLEDPEAIFVADDPYGEGWLLRLAPEDPADVERLLSAPEYLERAGVALT
jgi:glycine cleavage system H protein